MGPPLSARDVSREQITPIEGLSALSLDALTSVAYGPEAIIVVLAAAGAGALHLVVPITVGIVALLAILVLSYRQVIEAYPAGGGAVSPGPDHLRASGRPLTPRMGACQAGSALLPWMRAAERPGEQLGWGTGPMRGTPLTSSTRSEARVPDRTLPAVHPACALHLAEGSYAGGVCFAPTGQD